MIYDDIVFSKTYRVSKFLVSPIFRVYVVTIISQSQIYRTLLSLLKIKIILLSNRKPYYLELNELLRYSMILYYSNSLLKPVSLFSILSLWFYITIYYMGLFYTRVVQHLQYYITYNMHECDRKQKIFETLKIEKCISQFHNSEKQK